MGPPTSGPKQKVHSEYAVRCLLVCEVLPPVDVDEHFVAVDEDHPHLPGHGSDFGPKGDALGMAVLERNHEAVFLARKRSVRSDRLRQSDQGGRLLLSDQSPCTCICTGIHTLYIYIYICICVYVIFDNRREKESIREILYIRTNISLYVFVSACSDPSIHIYIYIYIGPPTKESPQTRQQELEAVCML